ARHNATRGLLAALVATCALARRLDVVAAPAQRLKDALVQYRAAARDRLDVIDIDGDRGAALAQALCAQRMGAAVGGAQSVPCSGVATLAGIATGLLVVAIAAAAGRADLWWSLRHVVLLSGGTSTPGPP